MSLCYISQGTEVQNQQHDEAYDVSQDLSVNESYDGRHHQHKVCYETQPIIMPLVRRITYYTQCMCRLSCLSCASAYYDQASLLTLLLLSIYTFIM